MHNVSRPKRKRNSVDDAGHYNDTTASAPGSDDKGPISKGAQGTENEGESAESEELLQGVILMGVLMKT